MARFAISRQASFSVVRTFALPQRAKVIILATALAVCGGAPVFGQATDLSAEDWSKVLDLAKSFGVAVSCRVLTEGEAYARAALTNAFKNYVFEGNPTSKDRSRAVLEAAFNQGKFEGNESGGCHYFTLNPHASEAIRDRAWLLLQ